MPACTDATRAYPDGRTGRDAGYQAHLKAGEPACERCRVAHLTACAERWDDLSDDERDARREANRSESARYRLNNPAGAKAAKDRYRSRNSSIIRDTKAKPCADCGVAHPYYVMQFDHLDGKAFNIGNIGPTASRALLIAEIAKCDVVCANCHAERTHQRRIAALHAKESADAR